MPEGDHFNIRYGGTSTIVFSLYYTGVPDLSMLIGLLKNPPILVA